MNVFLVTFQDNLHLHEIPIAPAYLMSYVKSLPELKEVNIVIRSYNIFVSKLKQLTQIRYLIKELQASNADVVGFSCYMWSIKLIESIIPQIKKKLPKIKIILGGPEVSPLAYETLSRNNKIDIIVRGEGEITLAKVLFSLLNSRSLSKVDGISYRYDNEIFENPNREQIKELNIIPSPILSGVLDKNIEKLDKNSINLFDIELARGCKRKCSYCYFGRGFNGVYRFSIKRIVEEIEYIVNYNTIPKYIVLWDSNLIQDTAYFKELCRQLIYLHKKYNIAFKSEIDIFNVTEEKAELLKQANVNVSLGLQTISKKSLRICNRKQLDPEKFSEKCAILKKAGIQFNFEMIMGLPGDSYQGVIDTIKFATSNKPHHVNAFPLFVLPGTLFYEKAEEYGIKVSPDVNHLMESSNDFSKQELTDLMSISTEMIERYNQGYLYNFEFNRNIIKATKQEVDKLKNLILQDSFIQISGKFSGGFTQLLDNLECNGHYEQNNANYSLLNFNNNEITGFITMNIDKTEKILHINEIWVRSDCNKKHCIEKLLETLLQKSVISNCDICILHDPKTNMDLIESYRFVKNSNFNSYSNYIPFAYKSENLSQFILKNDLNPSNFTVSKDGNSLLKLNWKNNGEERSIIIHEYCAIF